MMAARWWLLERVHVYSYVFQNFQRFTIFEVVLPLRFTTFEDINVHFKLLYIGWINKVLLYSTGNYIQYPVINHKGK